MSATKSVSVSKNGGKMHYDVDWMSKMITMTANRVGGIEVMCDEQQVDLAQKRYFLLQMSTVLSNNGQL